MLTKLKLWFHRLYEGEAHPSIPAAYIANPCDVGSTPALLSLGRAMSRLAVDCRCCSGARTMFAVVVTSYWPPFMFLIIAFVLGAWGYEAFAQPKETE